MGKTITWLGKVDEVFLKKHGETNEYCPNHWFIDLRHQIVMVDFDASTCVWKVVCDGCSEKTEWSSDKPEGFRFVRQVLKHMLGKIKVQCEDFEDRYRRINSGKLWKRSQRVEKGFDWPDADVKWLCRRDRVFLNRYGTKAKAKHVWLIDMNARCVMVIYRTGDRGWEVWRQDRSQNTRVFDSAGVDSAHNGMKTVRDGVMEALKEQESACKDFLARFAKLFQEYSEPSEKESKTMSVFTVIKYDVELFKEPLYLAIGDKAKLIEWTNNEFGVRVPVGDHCGAMHWCLDGGIEGGYVNIIWLMTWETTVNNIGTLLHEVIHYVVETFGNHNVPLVTHGGDGMQTQSEVMAYFTRQVFNALLERLLKDKELTNDERETGCAELRISKRRAGDGEGDNSVSTSLDRRGRRSAAKVSGNADAARPRTARGKRNVSDRACGDCSGAEPKGESNGN